MEGWDTPILIYFISNCNVDWALWEYSFMFAADIAFYTIYIYIG